MRIEQLQNKNFLVFYTVFFFTFTKGNNEGTFLGTSNDVKSREIVKNLVHALIYLLGCELQGIHLENFAIFWNYIYTKNLGNFFPIDLPIVSRHGDS